MKILMVADGMDIGGAETHILTLASELVRRGHVVDIASGGGALVPSLLRAGVRHIRLPLRRRGLGSLIRNFFALRRLCRLGYDAVHAHSRYPAAICARALKGSGIPLVTTAHWVFENSRVTRVLSRWGDGVLAVSRDIRDYLRDEYGISPDRVTLTLNGVELPRSCPPERGGRARGASGRRGGGRDFAGDKRFAFDGTRASDARAFDGGQRHSDFVISHVSRLEPDRADAAFALVACAARLSGDIPGLRVVIVGDGACLAELKERADSVNRRIGRECVRFTGVLTDVYSAIRESDLFVGVSRAALEAAACALPIILAGNEGYGSILCEENFDREAASNFCCRDGRALTVERLAADILRAFRDRELLGRSAEYCHCRVMGEYSAERMAMDAERVYAASARRVGADRSRGVMLCGYFGYGNVGDEASLEVTVEELRRAGYGRVRVLSARPRKTAAELGVKCIWRYNIARLVAEMVCFRPLFLLAGGNLLQDRTSYRSLLYYTELLQLASRLGCRCAVLGGGIGELVRRRARRRASIALGRCERLLLRTPSDCEMAHELAPSHASISICPDPAILVTPLEIECVTSRRWFLRSSGGAVLTVTAGGGVGQIETEAEVEAVALFVSFLCRRLELGAVFVPMHPMRDVAVCQQLRALCGGGSIAPPLSPRELSALLSCSSLAIGTRLHGAVMAVASGTPAILLGDGIKSRAAAELVADIADSLGVKSPLLLVARPDRESHELACSFFGGQKRNGAGAVARAMRETSGGIARAIESLDAE